MIYPEKIQQAVQLASHKHKDQKRSILDYPFITHPLMVMHLVSKFSNDKDVLCAAILHDIVEDTDTKLSEIEDLFGKKISYFVGILSHDRTLDYDERYKQYFNSILKENNKDIFLIKSADILYNLIDISEIPIIYREKNLSEILKKFNKYIKKQSGFIDDLKVVWPENPFLDDINFYFDKLEKLAENKR